MKQLLQNISNGDTLIEEVPVPSFGANEIFDKDFSITNFYWY